MGKLATVVYDAAKHVPVIVRTRTASPSERFGVIDAVAAFANHCESLQGIARSPVHVSALWGGPPFVTYQIVRSRFRVIVMWVEAPGDFDVAHDVQDALVRLHKAVSDVADGMMTGDPKALAHSYFVAGAVLDDDYVYALEVPAPAARKGSHGGLSAGGSPAGVGGRSPDTGAKKGFLRGLFSSGKHKGDDAASKISESDAHESNVLSILPSSDSMPFDDSPESLASISLPEEVFAFSDFGAPLSDSARDLAWVAKLIEGFEKPKSRPRPPVFRAISESTPTAETSQSRKKPEPPPAPGPIEKAQEPRAELPPQAQPQLLPNAAAVQQTHVTRGSESASEVEPPSRSPSMISSGRESAAGPTPMPVAPQGMPTAAPVAMPSPHPSHAPAASSAPVPSVPVAMGAPASAVQSRSSGSFPRPQAPSDDIPLALRAREDEFDVSGLGGIQDVAAAKALSTEGNSTSSSSGPPPPASQAIRARMNEFANTMQSGNYPLALQQVVNTLQGLRTVQPRPEREIITCSSYFLALKILIRVRVLENEHGRLPPTSSDAMRRVVEMAMLTMFLAEQKHLLPRHAVAAKKMAVEKNVVVGNFGMSARWLRTLVEGAPATQKAALEQRLQLCVRNREINAHMPPSKWLCYNSLIVIPQRPIKCGLCTAVFSPSSGGVVPNQQCPVCYIGYLAAQA